MNLFLKIIDQITDFAAKLSASFLVVLFLLMFTEVLLRSLFAVSLSFTIEYAGYLVALVFFWGSGAALKSGGHVRVAVLTDRLGADRRRHLDILASALALTVAGLVLFAWGEWVAGTAVRGSLSYFPTATPLIWPQLLFGIGPFVLALAALARLLRLLRGDITGEPAT